MNVVKLRHLSKSFGDETVLDEISYTFPAKGFFAIVGESGSGKTTLLEIIAGIDEEYEGEVTTLGCSLKTLSEDDRAHLRLAEIGFIRQGYDLLDLESAYENVMIPLRAKRMGKALAKRKAMDALKFLGLEDKAFQRVETLSGGEQQRVALARALAGDPRLILADEPSGALDETNAEHIYKALFELSKKKLVIIVTHDRARVSRFANVILRLERHRLIAEENPVKESEFVGFLSPCLPKTRVHGLSISLWIRHAIHILKAKKWRTFISISILFFSFLALGLSLYVSRDLRNELSSAFSELTGEGQIIVSKRNENESSLGRIISAPMEKSKELVSAYPELLRGEGCSYLSSFESYFPDANEIYMLSNGVRKTLSDFSVRSVNDFLWMEHIEKRRFYPEKPSVLENDQIVLGLPYENMVEISFALKILRNYQSLGEFLLRNGGLDVYLEVANDSWNYDDNHAFSVVAIIEYPTPTFFHYDHRWNEYVFEERMRFPSSDEDDDSLPWIMTKANYVESAVPGSEFLEAMRKDAECSSLLFERTSYLYDRTHNDENVVAELDRYFIYIADRHSLAFEDIASIGGDGRVSSYAVYGENAYCAYPDSLAFGFSNPFFLGTSLSDVELVSDGLSRTPLQSSSASISLPPNVVQGSVLLPRSSALTFSSDFRALKSGRKPKGVEEVCLSSGLMERLDDPSVVYASGMVSNKIVGDYLERFYRQSALKVVGVVEEPLLMIYGDAYWLIDFFRDALGMSVFYLEPTKMAIDLQDGQESESLITELSKAYPSYRFSDPSITISNSISSVVEYVDIALGFASVMTLLTSAFLLFTSAILSAMEGKREGKMLFTLGARREEIADFHGTLLLLMCAISCLMSVFGIFGLEMVFDRSIKSNFSSLEAFSPDFIPLIVIVAAAFIGFSLVFVFIRRWIARRDFTRGGS